MEHDAAARRAYWASQFDEAYAFMMKANDYPVADCGEGLVSLPDAARAAGVDVAFSQRPHAQGLPRVFVLREGQVAHFIDAARRLNRRGWRLRVEDGYRSRTMQKHLGLMPSLFDVILRKVIWELDGQTPDPAFFFKRLLTLVAQIPKTGTHMSGSAIDMSVLEIATGAGERSRDEAENKGTEVVVAEDSAELIPFSRQPPPSPSGCERLPGAEVDRGAPYIEMSERTPMNSPFVGEQARRNRLEITAIMREAGFVEYPYEFWHYSSGDVYEQILHATDRPARYGAVDFDPVSGKVTPIEDPEIPLNSLEELHKQIQAALDRRSS